MLWFKLCMYVVGQAALVPLLVEGQVCQQTRVNRSQYSVGQCT